MKNYLMTKSAAGSFGFGVMMLMATSAQSISLEQYLDLVSHKSKSYQSIEESLRAASTRYDQGDLELSPYLTASGYYQDDKSNQYGVGVLTNHQQLRQYSLGLAKKFSSGTQASVTGNVQAINAQGVASGSPYSAENHIGTMSFSLSQSLWKDFFGESTRLRWQRESAQKELEISSVELQRRSLLAEAEATYWDLMYYQSELQVRESSLERARKIESWVKSRVENGIGDKADLLNAQGLVASRELQLIGTKDDLKALQEKIRLQMGLNPEEILPNFEGNIKMERKLNDLVDGVRTHTSGDSSSGASQTTAGSRILRLDAWLTSLEADAKGVLALEAEEKVKPDLTLQTIYKTNSYETTDSSAFNRISNSDKPVFGVGLNFSWALDWGATGAVKSTARSEALAARLKKEQKILEGESAWKELSRRHKELGARIRAATQLAEIQTSKAAAEREKLSKGRTVTSNVITAEQDAAEAQLNLAKLNAEQRKLEGSARLFVSQN